MLWQIHLYHSFPAPPFFDRSTVTLLAEKPNRLIQTLNPSDEVVASAALILHNMSSIKDSEFMPGERFALPITGNMDYGFFGGHPLVRLFDTISAPSGAYVHHEVVHLTSGIMHHMP